MPGLVTPSPPPLLEAVINFAVPKSELTPAQQAKISAQFDADDPVPSRKATVPIVDLREELEAGMGGLGPVEQLDARG